MFNSFHKRSKEMIKTVIIASFLDSDIAFSMIFVNINSSDGRSIN